MVSQDLKIRVSVGLDKDAKSNFIKEINSINIEPIDIKIKPTLDDSFKREVALIVDDVKKEIQNQLKDIAVINPSSGAISKKTSSKTAQNNAIQEFNAIKSEAEQIQKIYNDTYKYPALISKRTATIFSKFNQAYQNATAAPTTKNVEKLKQQINDVQRELIKLNDVTNLDEVSKNQIEKINKLIGSSSGIMNADPVINKLQKLKNEVYELINISKSGNNVSREFISFSFDNHEKQIRTAAAELLKLQSQESSLENIEKRRNSKGWTLRKCVEN